MQEAAAGGGAVEARRRRRRQQQQVQKAGGCGSSGGRGHLCMQQQGTAQLTDARRGPVLAIYGHFQGGWGAVCAVVPHTWGPPCPASVAAARDSCTYTLAAPVAPAGPRAVHQSTRLSDSVPRLRGDVCGIAAVHLTPGCSRGGTRRPRVLAPWASQGCLGGPDA